jgi:uroporphyrinogen-III decarboxylase
MSKMNSRQRMLHTLQGGTADHIPCSFMSFAILRDKYNQDRLAAAKAELEMGLDPMLFIPNASRWERKDHPDLRGLPVRFHPDVKTRIWREGDGHTGRLYKEYHTPAGTLTTSVRLSEDWPHAEHIPFIDDYQIPRADQPLITSEDQLEALQYLLVPPQEEEILAYQKEATNTKDFADENSILLAGGWGVGMDMANWLCGMQNLMILMIEQPGFVAQILEMIHQWNVQRMRVILESGVDLFIRRAWYEGCDFVLPKFYQKEILPRLKAEVDLAHEYGAKFGYICSSGTKPMLDFYPEVGFDVLIGIDPVQGTHTDMPLMKQKLGGKVSLWGGVSAAVTVERGTEVEIQAAVQHAIKTLGPNGFILSPIDNFTVDEPKTWKNIETFIETWKSYWN